jgi:hypothetical protein
MEHNDASDMAANRPLDPKKLLREAIAGGEASAAAAGWQPPPLAELDGLFPELDVAELIGRGGMGAVYRAVQPKLGRSVALKVLPAELAADAAFEERFLREARALAGLQHPRILTVHDFGERDGLYYLVTEFVEGMNLRQLMDMGELSPEEALRITPQICEALQYAHDHGVVHRDIKPENVLIDRAGEVKIADFGLARILSEGGTAPALTRSTQVLGTPQYMAPEQWRHGAAVDHRADIYAVGVVLYEMLTGQLPIGHFDLPSKRRGVPHGLDAVVQRSLAQQPEERYQRASEVSDELARQRERVDCGPRRSCGPRFGRKERRGAGSAAGAGAGDRGGEARAFSRGTPPWQRRGSSGLPGSVRASWALMLVTVLGLLWFANWFAQREQEWHLAAGRMHEMSVAAQQWAVTQGNEQLLHTDSRSQMEVYLKAKLIPEWQERQKAAAESGAAFTEARPSLPELPMHGGPNSPVKVQVSVAFFLVALLFSLGGFVGIARIRSRRDGTAGLGLSMFTAWAFPLSLMIGIPAIVLTENISNPDTAILAATITGVAVLIAGIYWLSWQYRQLSRELRM